MNSPSPKSHVVYLSFGANLGDRADNIDRALALLRKQAGVTVEAVSAYHETVPVGGPEGQPMYLNAAARIMTVLDPFELLRCIHRIESALGRVRSVPNAARTLDVDILLYGDERIATPELTVPHPRMFEREFVMIPLREVYLGEI